MKPNNFLSSKTSWKTKNFYAKDVSNMSSAFLKKTNVSWVKILRINVFTTWLIFLWNVSFKTDHITADSYESTQLTFARSKSTIKTLENGVKYVQS